MVHRQLDTKKCKVTKAAVAGSSSIIEMQKDGYKKDHQLGDFYLI
jgi:hypothetical protein